jgi:hypothetical protein
MKKTVKVPFEIIIRNKKTKEEMKVGDLSIPVQFVVNKEQLHKIMLDNLSKEDEGVGQEE